MKNELKRSQQGRDSLDPHINTFQRGMCSFLIFSALFFPFFFFLNRLIAAVLFYHVSQKCQCKFQQARPKRSNMLRLNVKSVQGSLTKEIGFYAARASIHNTPKTKGKSKALIGYFRPIIISHKSQTSQDQRL